MALMIMMHLMAMIIVAKLEIDSIKSNAKKRNNSLGVTNAYKAHQRGNQRDNYFQFSQILKITLIMFSC